MSAWVLPDHIADILPSEARHLEELRRRLVDTAGTFGYEIVIPPLLEHLESLLTGAGKELDLQTFKLVDQLSGRMLGLRADTTQQVARIDAHLLNRNGVTRLCYCGPIVHTRPDNFRSTREPLQFGAEIYGCSAIEADAEIIQLALNCLHAAQVSCIHLDLGDARIVQAILKRSGASVETGFRIYEALAAKDRARLEELTNEFSQECRAGLKELLNLYGDASVIERARISLKDFPEIQNVLVELKVLASQVKGVSVAFDLADIEGYSYYSGLRFSIYSRSAGVAIARGGRYDKLGAIFGRNRPAVGFSLDLRMLVEILKALPLRKAIKAPWPLLSLKVNPSNVSSLQDSIKMLRASGETVICASDGDDINEFGEFSCERELVFKNGRWIIENI